jgi:hypothetical protein
MMVERYWSLGDSCYILAHRYIVEDHCRHCMVDVASHGETLVAEQAYRHCLEQTIESLG